VRRQSCLIIGAGQCGARAALALRAHDPSRHILLIGEESALPYERPPLSKAVLCGTAEPNAGELYREEELREARINLALDVRVAAVNLDESRVQLVDGRSYLFDDLILATGASARTLDVLTPGMPGVHYLRDKGDAARLRGALLPGAEILVVGGGFLGLEIAASASQCGCRVTVVECGRQLLGRAASLLAAQQLQDKHAERGVSIHLRCQLRRAESRKSGKWRVELSDGTALCPHAIVVAIGSVANDQLARAAGLICNDGVAVNASGRSSHPHVFAAGDVACRVTRWRDSPMRFESWDNAEESAKVVSAAVAGTPPPLEPVPYFWTDQYDVTYQLLGLPTEAPQQRVERNADGSVRTIQHLNDEGQLQFAELINAARERRALTRLIEQAYTHTAHRNAS